jgi:hypothetical protein
MYPGTNKVNVIYLSALQQQRNRLALQAGTGIKRGKKVEIIRQITIMATSIISTGSVVHHEN